MPIFGDQRERLVRETWGSTNELAEELYAMFGVNTPLQIDGPVQITNTTPQPGLTVNQLGAFDPGDFPAGLTPPPSPGVSILFATTDPTPSPVAPPLKPGAGTTQNKITVNPGGAMPGQIQSGSGASYSVQVWPDGLTGKPDTVTATQLSIDPAETIKAGTWTLVVQAGDDFYIQEPVWGAP